MIDPGVDGAAITDALNPLVLALPKADVPADRAAACLAHLHHTLINFKSNARSANHTAATISVAHEPTRNTPRR